ncbi:esterase-like activity of phytase family protein [Rubellimicrobium roseum]|nr:esterase-like activity of phytase family protein [Rubellimicrobium roseum]
MAIPSVLILAVALGSPAASQQRVDATLAGHSRLPAATFSAPPPDAPRENFLSGRFLDPLSRVDEPYSVPQRTGLPTPFLGQPVQGISGFAQERPATGGIWAVIDNGFGSKRNSPDALLSFVHLVPEFGLGTIRVANRIWLRDPDQLVPFRIVQEGTQARYLTGGDFDPESIQVIGDQVWIGDEFGPFLLSATLDGRITGIYSTIYEGRMLRSPDHPSVAPGTAPGPATWQVANSAGFEGLGLAPDGQLWAVLEQPLRTSHGATEDDVLLLQFDPVQRAWTGEVRRLALTEGATSIGDISFVDARHALVIERDNHQGDAARACAEVTPPADAGSCFPEPAQVKRVTMIDLGQRDASGRIARLDQIDLLGLSDPQGIGPGRIGDRFLFPFQTIESVVMDGPDHILVANDNNLPFSSGRSPDQADDTEMIRLHVPELLAR